MPDIKLIAFDLDGVLADGGGSWITVHEQLGTREQAHANAGKYFNGEISFTEWAKIDVELWDGVEINEIKRILYSVPLMNGARETLTKLKENHVVGIISGGLMPLAEKISDEFSLDFCHGNRLLAEDGRVVGVDNSVDFSGKGEIIKSVAAEHNIPLSFCAAVGDYLNDIPMFNEVGFSIAFNPQHPDVVKNADAVVTAKDLSLILKYL